MLNLTIQSMADLSQEKKKDVAKVFVSAFYPLYTSFAKTEAQLVNAFEEAFQEDIFHIAYAGEQPVGIIGCSNNQKRGLQLDKKKLQKSLGFIRGTIAYKVLSKDFHSPLPYDDHVGYIEFIATTPEARGKKVAQRLIQDLFNRTDYTEFILEVGDTNEVAVNLYKKMGFNEFERKMEEYPKQTGFNERIFMKIENPSV